MAEYYTTLTTIGADKVAIALSGGPALQLQTIAVGDGGAANFYDLYDREALKQRAGLVNQHWSDDLNLVDVDPNNPAWVITEGLIPTHVGGWYIREVGIFDAAGDMIAIGVYPETYKPVATAVEADLLVRSILEVGDADSVELKIDPSQVMATRAWVIEIGIPQALTMLDEKVDEAEASAIRAETARDAATVNADSYDNVSAGLDATSSGEQFQVTLSNEIVRYRNDAGSAVEVARYPSALFATPQRGGLGDESSINVALLPGVYFLRANGNFIGMPSDAPADASYWLEVDSYGVSAAGTATGRFFKQTLWQFFPERDWFQTWTRRLDTSNIETNLGQWVRGPRSNHEVFCQRGYPAATTYITSLSAPGTYLLGVDREFRGVPEGYDQSRAHFLTVESVGPTNGSPYGDTRFFKQTLTEITPGEFKNRIRWFRRGDTTSPTSTTGENAWELDSVPYERLYLPRGSLPEEADFDQITEPGMYLGIPGGSYLNTPPGLSPSSAFWLEVSAPGSSTGAYPGRFVYQAVKEHEGNSKGFRKTFNRRLDLSNPDSAIGMSAWALEGASADSRFAMKTIVTLGDSITEGSGGYSWPAMFAEMTGANVINGGFGGCRMAVHDHSSVGHIWDPFCMYRLSERIAGDAAGSEEDGWQSLIESAQIKDAESGGTPFTPIAESLANLDWSDVDYVVIAYGTNDFRGSGGDGVPIGTDEDMTGETFKGAINVTINNILTARPGIKILFATPLWRSRVSVSGEDSNVTPNGSGVFLREYADAIVSRAKAYQIPVLDLHDECGINILNWEHYTPDGLHPWTTPGIELIASKVSGGLSRFY